MIGNILIMINELLLVANIVIFLVFSYFLNIIILLFCNLRSKYSYNNEDYNIKDKLKFNLSYLLVIIIPVLLIGLICSYDIIYFILKINLRIIEKNVLLFVGNILLLIILIFIGFVIYKKKINFSKYDEICLKYSIRNDKILITILYFIVIFILSLSICLNILLLF